MIHEFEEDNNFTDDMSFGEFIRKKRRLMGYNQMDFSRLIGVNQGTLSQWELENRFPSIEKAEEIVARLGGKILIVNLEEDKDNGYQQRS